MGALESLVDAEVDGGEEDERDDSCGKQSCPVGVVHDVGGIQPGIKIGYVDNWTVEPFTSSLLFQSQSLL